VATIFPTSDEFAALAATHGVVPVWTELEADAETPVTAFAKTTRPDEPAFLFESAEQDEKSGRYSILGTGAEREFIARGDRFEIRRDGQTIRSGTAPDPLAELEREMSGLRAPAGSLHFPGGCVGYLSYDAIGAKDSDCSYFSCLCFRPFRGHSTSPLKNKKTPMDTRGLWIY
jgi:anthranilate synthase component 1